MIMNRESEFTIADSRFTNLNVVINILIYKDVQFYSDAPDMYFQLTNEQFAIFFPENVHAPMIGKTTK